MGTFSKALGLWRLLKYLLAAVHPRFGSVLEPEEFKKFEVNMALARCTCGGSLLSQAVPGGT